MRVLVVFSILLALSCGFVSAWSNDEYELFDLVEEVNKNFYELLEIPKDAGATEIRKAFRKLSLVLHPDKNPAADADVKFRQLVGVYDVIKDAAKRKMYDDILVNGLPDWRSAVYYFRRVRKMGLGEMSAILFIIITIGQYLVGWGSYLEQKFVAQEFISSKMKKQQKKSVKKIKGENSSIVDEVMLDIPTPSIKDTLPFQIPRLLWWIVTKLPFIILNVLQERKRHQEELRLIEEEERAEAEAAAAAAAERAERGPRKRKGFTLPEVSSEESNAQLSQAQILALARKEMKLQVKKPAQSGGLWTDEDIEKLVKLVKKYPAGTLERWEKIADTMERTVQEVTLMAHRVKEDGYKTPSLDRRDSGEEMQHLLKAKKLKTKGGKHGDWEPTEADADFESKMESWTQVQQKALEAALIKYPKGSTQDRWDKIAKCVPEKSKEDCMQRFKYLVDMLKKKKEKEAAIEEDSNPPEDVVKSEETDNAVDLSENLSSC
ncbi:dnaJ homolog subfamily C member 1 [Thrips palmi]|uniref:DnaJ homolog subfamily C member 1 n=1 Tax=Thrips palmi TaxID=161013 RepID=A0A6P8ZSC0_THRPL|nr:dnaJ homolog subfamily C member 1 [Thrips palmi]